MPARVGVVASGKRSLLTAEPPAESRDDDGSREEMGPHENGFGGGVVGSCDRWDERQAGGDCGDDDEPSTVPKESGQHDAQSGTDEGPPRERGDRNGCAVDFETDIGSARMAARRVVQTAAVAPASAPLRTRRRVLGWVGRTTGSWWVECWVVVIGVLLAP